jgi:hypothetical protein
MAGSQAEVLASVIFGFQSGKRLIEKLVEFLIVLRGVSLEFATKVGWNLEVQRHSTSPIGFLRQRPGALIFCGRKTFCHKSPATFFRIQTNQWVFSPTYRRQDMTKARKDAIVFSCLPLGADRERNQYRRQECTCSGKYKATERSRIPASDLFGPRKPL